MPEIFFFPPLNTDAYILLGTAVVVAIIINLIPVLSYPFYLFFALIHEVGHVVATKLSGGDPAGFWVFSNTTGVALRKGGSSFWVAPAGYLGTSLFGMGLILLSGLPHWAPYTLGLLGVFLLLITLNYGQQTPVVDGPQKGSHRPVTMFVGLSFSILFIGVALLAHRVWSIFLLYLLAIQAGLISLQLLDELTEQVRENQKDIDPAQMPQPLGCSPMMWTRAWKFFSILILASSVWIAWL